MLTIPLFCSPIAIRLAALFSANWRGNEPSADTRGSLVRVPLAGEMVYETRLSIGGETPKVVSLRLETMTVEPSGCEYGCWLVGLGCWKDPPDLGHRVQVQQGFIWGREGISENWGDFTNRESYLCRRYLR